MMGFPDRDTVEQVRKEYPVGTRVILESMNDPQAPPIGTMGTVRGVDDTGSLLMCWEPLPQNTTAQARTDVPMLPTDAD